MVIIFAFIMDLESWWHSDILALRMHCAHWKVQCKQLCVCAGGVGGTQFMSKLTANQPVECVDVSHLLFSPVAPPDLPCSSTHNHFLIYRTLFTSLQIPKVFSAHSE